MPERKTPEARTGLAPFRSAELPAPPRPRGLAWLGVVGPGVIVLGASIGGGEFLLGPSAFVRYGLVLLWVTLVATFLQTVFNTELMRWTIATGEPAFTGFMRTRPAAPFWAVVYALLYFLQRLRDEAHRFAIGTHRAKRAKARARSALDEIPGVGPRRKKALLHRFGSARGVSQAGLADLETVDGISSTVARAIHDHFRADS